MKKIFLSIFAIIFLLFAAFPVFAQDNENVVLSRSDTHEGDYFGAGERVEIAGTVNGDAYVGGATVLVTGKINGDLLGGGANVTISGNVEGDVRVGGGNVTFSNADIGGNVTVGGGNIVIDNSTTIQGSLVAGGGNMQILAPIGRGATIGAGSALIANSVGGDINAGVGELTLAENAEVNGNITYWSESKANISGGASVSGTIKQEIPEKDKEGAKDVATGAGLALAGFVFTLKLIDIAWLLIIGLLAIALLPVYSARAANTVADKFGWTLLTGLIAAIVIPVIGIFLLITIIGIPVALVIFIIYGLAMWFGRIFSIYALGRFVLSRTGNTKATYWAYVAGIVIYLILGLIPIINFITDILIGLSGFGAFLMAKREYYTDLRKKKLL